MKTTTITSRNSFLAAIVRGHTSERFTYDGTLAGLLVAAAEAGGKKGDTLCYYTRPAGEPSGGQWHESRIKGEIGVPKRLDLDPKPVLPEQSPFQTAAEVVHA